MKDTPRILLVEDREDDVLLFMRALRKSGMKVEVDVAENGVAAIEYLEIRKSNPRAPEAPLPVVVLLDINMPVVNGFEVLEWIQSNPEISQETRSVFLTSSDALADHERAKALKVEDYWLKPNSQEGYSELMESLKNCLAQPGTDPDRLDAMAKFP
jgi:CheY-like chemotaxis protein